MTNKPYRVTHGFELDFWDIQDWLYTNESTQRADKIIASILEKLDYINQNPFHFPEHFQKGTTNQQLRRAIHFDTYVIYYCALTDCVEFLSIFHSKRDRSK